MRDNSFPLYEVIVSSLVAIVPVFLLSPALFFSLFAVTGHAHFISAFFYQWKAGKATPVFMLCLAQLALAVAAFVTTAPLLWQVVFAGVLFMAHHAFDEFRLVGYAPTFRRVLECATPALLFTGIFLATIFTSATLTIACYGLAVLTGASVLVYIARKEDGYRADHFLWYALTATAFAVLLILFKGEIAPEYLIGVVILYHYSKWYLYSYRRMPKGTVRNGYVRTILGINAVVAALFFVSLPLFSLPFVSVLHLAFMPTFFYFMTIMHILASFMQFGFHRYYRYASAHA